MDPRYPPTEGWPYLVNQLLDSIDEPVYGVGHSLGGYLNFLAAARRPDAAILEFKCPEYVEELYWGPYRKQSAQGTN